MSTRPNPSGQTIKQTSELRINKAILAEFEKMKIDDPSLASFHPVYSFKLFKKNPPGFDKVTKRLIEVLIQTIDGFQRTQADIARQVQSELNQFLITPRIWTRPLPSYEWKAIEKLIRNSSFSNVSIRGLKTPSAIRKRLEVAQHRRTGEQSAKVEITISKTAVTINSKVFSIVNKTAVNKTGKKYSYPSIRVRTAGKLQWMKLATVEALLFDAG